MTLTERTRNNLLKLLLSRQDDIVNGVDKYFHSLQTATRAFHDGKDDEYVVCALFHDVAGGICPEHHGLVGALLLEPFICDRNYLVLMHHDTFQLDNWNGKKHREPRNEIEARVIEFVDKYDFPSFDPNYPTEPLETFLPIVQRIIK